MKRLSLLLSVLLTAGGCARKSAPSPADYTPPHAQSMSVAKSEKNAAPARPVSQQQPKSREPFSSVGKITRGDIPTAVQVTIYQLSVPFGTVSRNEKFWKRIDESAVDLTTYETLFKNGVRVGEAPTEEWEYFRKIMEENPAVTRVNSLVSMDGKTVELPLKKDIQHQNIFYFDASNPKPHGRTYESCENLMTMVLQPAPRKRDTVRLTLCPVVRAVRKRLEFSTRNREEGEIVYQQPERLYDLNLRVDVPLNTFFVVSPSGQATWPTSLGNTFLVSEGAAERMETVLLLVPQIVKMEVGPVLEQRDQMPTDKSKPLPPVKSR
ncbi:MAG TPA: hypothetical protein VF669_10305 [Tepidisphaeraceae bacterium]|jgi:hypothetical protein